MTDQKENSSGGGSGEAGGDAGEGDKNKVSYETHQRLLSQYKKNQEEQAKLKTQLATIENEKRTAEESVLASKGEFKTLVESRDAKITELTQKLNDTETKLSQKDKVIQDSKKLSAFNSKLPAPLKKPDYYAFVDLDSIVTTEDGVIDDVSLNKAVADFVSNHGEDLLQKTAGGMPSAAASGKATLTYDEWLKLPVKEQRKRLSEVAH